MKLKNLKKGDIINFIENEKGEVVLKFEKK